MVVVGLIIFFVQLTSSSVCLHYQVDPQYTLWLSSCSTFVTTQGPSSYKTHHHLHLIFEIFKHRHCLCFKQITFGINIQGHTKNFSFHQRKLTPFIAEYDNIIIRKILKCRKMIILKSGQLGTVCPRKDDDISQPRQPRLSNIQYSQIH